MAWEKDKALQDEIIRHVETAEAASGEIMHLLDQMVEEKHAAS